MAYSIVSSMSVLVSKVLKRHLKNPQLVTQNIYEVENLKTPFVIGFIKPKIYLPVNLGIEERSYILLHEQTHINRKDHIIKIFAFIILSIHWFNPLVWIAFKLNSTDMELSCDERVLKKMSNDLKKPYATSLLSLAVGRNILNGSPIAFGEGNLKERIKNVLNYKKPKFRILIISIVIVTVVGIGLIANPKAVGIIDSSDVQTDLFISSENKAIIADADGVKLYANKTENGLYNGIIVEAKAKIKAFPWINVTNPIYAPSLNFADVNLDGNDEVIITLTNAYGTGILQQEIHVLNTKELSEINIQNPIEIINKKVTSRIVEDEGKVNITVKWGERVIENSYYSSDYADVWFDEVIFESIINYEVIDNKIFATVPGAVSPSSFPITAFIEYGPDLKASNIAISLYSVPDSTFSLPLTEIPYYQRGEAVYKDEFFFEQWNKGHQPWLGNAIDVVTVMCPNLIDGDIKKIFSNENIELHTAEALRTKNGIEIKIIDKTDNNIRVELKVPGLGRYEVSLVSPETTGILFIKEIVFYPDSY